MQRLEERANRTLRADHAILFRLMNGLVRESLLPEGWAWTRRKREECPELAFYVDAGIHKICELSHPERTFRAYFPVKHEGAFGRFQFAGPLWMKSEYGLEPLTDLASFIRCLREQVGLSISASLERELLNSRDNLVLAYEVWANKSRRFEMTENSFVQEVGKRKQAGMDEILYSESLVIEGHPLHPCTKTKIGFSAAEVKRYAPEFEPVVPIRWVLVPKCYAVETQVGGETAQARLFAAHLELKTVAMEAARSRGNSLDAYQLFPVHPWQYEHVLPQLFREKSEDWVEVPVTIAAKPTLSFRTMSLAGSGLHVKLPVRVQATSAVRTVSPQSTVNGPLLSRCLEIFIKKDPRFRTLRILADLSGVYYHEARDEDGILGRNLAFLLRENPQRQIEPQELCFVGASLTAMTPGGRLLILDLIEETGELSVVYAIRYLRHYARQLLGPLLILLIQHGIALEAHMQNSMVVTEKGWVKRFVLRDLGGVRIDRSRFPFWEELGRMMPSHILADGLEEGIHLFSHTVLQNHLGEIIFALASHFDVPESVFWEEVRQVIEEMLERVEAPWLTAPFLRTKALLTMRFKKTAQDYLYTDFPNPLLGRGEGNRGEN